MTIRKTNSIKIHKSDTSLVSKLFFVFFKNFWDVVILIYGTIFLWWFLCPYSLQSLMFSSLPLFAYFIFYFFLSFSRENKKTENPKKFFWAMDKKSFHVFKFSQNKKSVVLTRLIFWQSHTDCFMLSRQQSFIEGKSSATCAG